MLQHYHDNQPTVLFVLMCCMHLTRVCMLCLLVHAGHLHDELRVQTMVDMLLPELLDIMGDFLTLKEEESRQKQPGSLVHSDHLIQAVLACILKDVRAQGGPDSLQAPDPEASPDYTWSLIVCKRVVHCFCKSVRLCICMCSLLVCGTQSLNFCCTLTM